MQFAGQRTDMELKPIGEPVNLLIKLTPDVLPEPDAILVTGITPQQTLIEGLTEAEFLKIFYEEVVTPETIFVGFNSVRFDDEFMRFLNYRNFYDAYGWQWQDSRSRWDILDLVRMTRALRPNGIKWPFAPDGKPANRLEFLTKVNKLDHGHVHDALSDVIATIAVTNLVKSKQSELFEYLLKMRDKKHVAQLVNKVEPFVYTSGRFPSESLHTTAVVLLAKRPQQDAALVYDLRHDPKPFLNMSVDQIVEAWRYTKDPDALRLPVKTLKYNRCPAIAPIGVIKDAKTQERIGLTMSTITGNLNALRLNQKEFASKVLEAVAAMDEVRQKEQSTLVDNQLTVDERLYENFISNGDKNNMELVRSSSVDNLIGLAPKLNDERLRSLLPLYKARNYAAKLTSEERIEWEKYCHSKLFEGGDSSRIAKFFKRLDELSETKLTDGQKYLVEELKLYGESIVPTD